MKSEGGPRDPQSLKTALPKDQRDAIIRMACLEPLKIEWYYSAHRRGWVETSWPTKFTAAIVAYEAVIAAGWNASVKATPSGWLLGVGPVDDQRVVAISSIDRTIRELEALRVDPHDYVHRRWDLIETLMRCRDEDRVDGPLRAVERSLIYAQLATPSVPNCDFEPVTKRVADALLAYQYGAHVDIVTLTCSP